MNSRGLRRHHGSRLSRAQRVATYAAFAAAWLSGTFWLLFHYFLRQQGEFALEPHPFEHWWLRLHGLCAFVLLWLGGLLWALHVRDGLGWPRRRGSGLTIASAFCVLAATGYLLYYSDEGATRDAIGALHWALGLSMVVPLVLHALPSYRVRGRAPDRSSDARAVGSGRGGGTLATRRRKGEA
jgi:hypothetical protein